tara:strand:- start:2459 stop:2710 length:252 start_codon:yes stop_codon:yes gene_type:complete
MLEKIFKFFFILSQSNSAKTLYYRMALVNGEQGCIQGIISEKMSVKFNAKKGSCTQVGCTKYRGTTKIPFCCQVEGYSCSEYI